MVNVAIAGGTGGMGKTIAAQLQLTDEHQTFILCRKLPSGPLQQSLRFLVVDYNDVEGIAKVLEENLIDTVISTIGLQGQDAFGSQLNLITAADKSSPTRRFIPSEFGFYIEKTGTEVDKVLSPWLDTVDALRKSGLQFTRVVNGWLMDYFGQPNIASEMSPYVWALDPHNRQAAIPGTGNSLMTFTYSVDVARFVVQLLKDEHWSEHSIISGVDTTFNQTLAIAERVIGEKFHVVYDSEEKLRCGRATLLSEGYGADQATQEESERMVAMFGVMAIEGSALVPRENRLNDKYPLIKPMGIEEMLVRAWGKE